MFQTFQLLTSVCCLLICFSFLLLFHHNFLRQTEIVLHKTVKYTISHVVPSDFIHLINTKMSHKVNNSFHQTGFKGSLEDVKQRVKDGLMTLKKINLPSLFRFFSFVSFFIRFLRFMIKQENLRRQRYKEALPSET